MFCEKQIYMTKRFIWLEVCFKVAVACACPFVTVVWEGEVDDICNVKSN